MKTALTETHTPLPLVAGRYQITGRLARGGMADVYQARDLVLDRPVALKILFAHYAANPSFVERFRREAQAAGGLNHPNIAAVFDWGRHEDTYYIAMEFVVGKTLHAVLAEQGPLTVERSVQIAGEVAIALGTAHQAGLVHRDIKPANVMITPNGVAKVTDFGIARAAGAVNDLTDAGQVMGTAEYLSPEQAQGFAVDQRSDLYSLGVVLFEMVTGRPPFTGPTPVAVAQLHVDQQPPPPSSRMAGIPPAIDRVIGRLLAKNPDDRYGSSAELRADLDRLHLNDRPQEVHQQDRGSAAPRADNQDDLTGVMPRTAAPNDFAPIRNRPEATAAMPPPMISRQYDEEPDYRRRTEVRQAPGRAGIYIAIVAVLIVALIATILIIAQGLRTNEAGEIAVVPSVIGETEAAASSSIVEAGLIPILEFEKRDDTEPGLVFAQRPDPGTELESGDEVTIFVSAADETVEVPDVSNMAGDDARARLRELGFEVTFDVQPSDEVAEGRVISQSVSAGQEANKGSSITLVISSGSALVEVPDVRNLTEADAQRRLRESDLTVRVELVDVDPSEGSVGRVISQTPEFGSELAAGETVTIRVGTADQTTTSTASSTTTTNPPTTTATTQATTATTAAQSTTAATSATTATTEAPPTSNEDG